MRQRTRNKRLRASQTLLGSTTRAMAYGIGLMGPDPRQTTIYIVGGAIVLVILFAVVAGPVVIPGVLALALIFYAIDQPAAVVVTNTGVAILTRSVFTGRPKKLLSVVPLSDVADSRVQPSGSFVELPSERIWLRKREFEFLASAARAPAHPIEQPSERVAPAVGRPPAPAGPSPGWYPVGGRFDEVVFWDGRKYTARNLWRDDAWHDVPLNFYSGGPPKPEDRLEK